MSYQFYMNKILLPIPPETLTISAPNRNEVVELIDGSQINILKEPGLKEIQFEITIPQVEYPFAVYQRGLKFRKPEKYISKFEALKKSKRPFQFIVNRYVPRIESGNKINSSFSTNLKVSLEEFQQVEDANNGFDLKYSITLKEYVDYGTKEFKLADDGKTAEPIEPERPVEPNLTPLPNQRRTYTVKSGDSLWAICARELGSGSKCMAAAKKNGIANPDLIQIGQILDLTGL